MRKATGWAVLIGTALLGVIQLLPFGHDHTNPPVRKEPEWDAPETRELAARACFDCHSNQTVWPWYSNVAPVSWLVWSDVVAGAEGAQLLGVGPAPARGPGSGQHGPKGVDAPLVLPWARLIATERGRR